jgi:hypothetical protein
MKHLLLLLIGSMALVGCQVPPGSEVKRAIVPEATAVISGRVSSVNDIARYLAGMPGGVGSPLTAARQTDHWSRYSRNMDELWRRYSVQRQPKIAAFSRSQLGGARSAATVWYPFSGPDALFADAFFPNASNYILCGLEGSDMLPNTESLSDEQRRAGLDGLYTSLTTSLSCSFFVTKDMRVDLQRTAYRGTLPLVLVFLARLGYDIDSIDAISLDAAGNLISGGNRSSCPGYAVTCRSGFGRTKRFYYFTENVANSNLRGDRRYLNFVARFGSVVTYLKSASYLMHSDEFSVIRQAVLKQSSAVLQDDSGIPISAFGSNWAMSYYGNYVGVLEIFRSYYQPKLAEIYRRGGPNVSQMDFGVGYRFETGDSSLILARRRS